MEGGKKQFDATWATHVYTKVPGFEGCLHFQFMLPINVDITNSRWWLKSSLSPWNPMGVFSWILSSWFWFGFILPTETTGGWTNGWQFSLAHFLCASLFLCLNLSASLIPLFCFSKNLVNTEFSIKVSTSWWMILETPEERNLTSHQPRCWLLSTKIEGVFLSYKILILFGSDRI